MYLGKRKKWKSKDYEERRNCIIETKSGATWNTFVELEGVISHKEFAEQYFGKTNKWMTEKLANCGLENNKAFTEEEYTLIIASLRDIAKRLLAHADEIERAEVWTTEFLEKQEKEKE